MHFTFSPHVRAIATKATGSLCILKALAGTNWGFSKEDIIATYRTITRPILSYAASIWYPFASRTAMASLQTIQNTALRLATSCLKMAPIAHLHQETGVLPLSAHLDLACAQFLTSALPYLPHRFCSPRGSPHEILHPVKVRPPCHTIFG